MRTALKQLVLDGLVLPVNDRNGIMYRITDAGKTYSQSLDSDYAKEYRYTAQKAVELVSDKTERSIIEKINKMSAESLRKGTGA